MRFALVVIDAASTQARAGEAPVERLVAVDDADAARGVIEDAVARQEHVDLVGQLHHPREAFAEPLDESGRQIGRDAADPGPARRDPRSGPFRDAVPEPLAGLGGGAEAGGGAETKADGGDGG